MVAQPREEHVTPGTSRRRSRWSLPLLGVLAVVLAASVAWRMYSERSGWSSVSTAIGDYRRLPLSDGSTLELNTATEVRYRLTEQVRLLDIATGEARVRVAHDPQRPFIVSARDTVIRDVGTEFTVRIRENGKVEVLVSEGSVAVSHWPRGSRVSEFLLGRDVPLAGGTPVPEKRLLSDDGGRLAMVEMSRAKVEAHDAWRNNMLVFDETPLRDIVEDFNRYNRRKLEIVDPAMGNVQFGGRYRPRDVEGFLQNLSAVMPVRVSEDYEDGGKVVLRLYPARKD